MPAAAPGHVVDCPQCNHPLWRRQVHPFKYIIACSLSAAMFYGFAVVAPFLEISAHGRFQLAKLETGPDQLMSGGFQMVGALVLASSTYINPGTVDKKGSYNHYSALRTYEDLLGITSGGSDHHGHLGMAGAPGLAAFGRDVFNASS